MAGNGISRFSATVLEATTAAEFRTAIGAGSGSATGDVVGPASAVDGNIAVFDGTTGKLIDDSGVAFSDIAAASHTHAASAITSGTLDAARIPTLDAISTPVASVNFNGQQATSFVIENRTSDPGSPTTGQIWLRTDL